VTMSVMLVILAVSPDLGAERHPNGKSRGQG
jgi:hypothetical protein